MKPAIVFTLCISLIFVYATFVAKNVRAAGLGGKPFGGKVEEVGPIGNFMCTGGTGPVIHQPIGKSQASYYFYPIMTGFTKGGSKSAPKAGDYVLGLYDEQPNMTSCYYQYVEYRENQSVYNVSLFGKSGK